MVVRGEKINVLIPQGMVEQISRIMREDPSWISAQEFIRQSVAEKIDRWKREHAEISGHP